MKLQPLTATILAPVALCGCDGLIDEIYLEATACIDHFDEDELMPREWLVARRWMPPSLPSNARIENLTREHRNDVSHIAFVLDEADALALMELIQPIDWSRFPGSVADDRDSRVGDHGQTSQMSAGTILLIHGETCERGIYWRYSINEDYRGVVSSGTYQPGLCPVDEEAVQ